MRVGFGLTVRFDKRARKCYNRRMNEITVRTYAKINLFLTVTGIENRDGKALHALDTVMCSIGISDDVKAVKRSDGEIRVFFNGELTENTNAEKAAKAMRDLFRLLGADFYVTTRIPSGAGLGGSSADAAGVINAYRLLYGVNASESVLKRIAFSVGSDVPYMLGGGLKRLKGTGENVTSINADFGGEILLCGRGKVDTYACFSDFDRLNYAVKPSADEFIDGLKRGEIEPYNALEAAAERMEPNIKIIRDIMSDCGLKSAMTGSGAFVFGLGGDLGRAKAELGARGYDSEIINIVKNGYETL